MNDKSEKANTPRHAALIKLGVASLVLLLVMAGFKGYRDLAYVKGQEAALAGQIQETEKRIEGLKERIGRIKHDPTALEQIAREELAWVRDGDVVIVLPEDASPKAASPGGASPEERAAPAR